MILRGLLATEVSRLEGGTAVIYCNLGGPPVDDSNTEEVGKDTTSFQRLPVKKRISHRFPGVSLALSMPIRSLRLPNAA